nr:hypothetical protein [Paracoccus yeei]
MARHFGSRPRRSNQKINGAQPPHTFNPCFCLYVARSLSVLQTLTGSLVEQMMAAGLHVQLQGRALGHLLPIA